MLSPSDAKAFEKGLLLVKTGRESIKIGPPLKITKKELSMELDSLKAFGLTREELEGFVDFCKYTLEMESSSKRRIRVLNGKSKNLLLGGKKHDNI